MRPLAFETLHFLDLLERHLDALQMEPVAALVALHVVEVWVQRHVAVARRLPGLDRRVELFESIESRSVEKTVRINLVGLFELILLGHKNMPNN